MTTFSKFIPPSTTTQHQSSVHALNQCFEQGESALAIIDVRPKVLFDITHIVGAISMPMDEVDHLTLANLGLDRNIYVYAETNRQTAIAAQNLRQIGYQNVSELLGGLTAWKKAKYPIIGWWLMARKKA